MLSCIVDTGDSTCQKDRFRVDRVQIDTRYQRCHIRNKYAGDIESCVTSPEEVSKGKNEHGVQRMKYPIRSRVQCAGMPVTVLGNIHVEPAIEASPHQPESIRKMR